MCPMDTFFHFFLSLFVVYIMCLTYNALLYTWSKLIDICYYYLSHLKQL